MTAPEHSALVALPLPRFERTAGLGIPRCQDFFNDAPFLLGFQGLRLLHTVEADGSTSNQDDIGRCRDDGTEWTDGPDEWI